MRPVEKLATVSPALPNEDMARLFRETFHHGFAVVDSFGDFCGLITLQDLERSAMRRRQ